MLPDRQTDCRLRVKAPILRISVLADNLQGVERHGVTPCWTPCIGRGLEQIPFNETAINP